MPEAATMRAVRAQGPGGPEVLDVVDVAVPEPGPGQIRVRHAAIGLNFIDVYHRTGLYPLPYPTGLGLEAAGTVEAVGEGVTRFSIGDRVAYANGPAGAYAQAHVVEANRAVRVPDDVPLETAAAAMLKGMTSEALVRRVFHVKQGNFVLVQAAAGGVGLILCQWAQAVGATVIGSVGSEAKVAIAKAHGCAHVVLSGAEDVVDQVRALTGGQGVAVAYDSVGKATFDASLACLARRGMLVAFGNASGPAAPVDPLRLARGGSLFLTRPTLFDYIATVEDLDASAEALFGMIASGQVRIEIGQTWPLEKIREAHTALEARATTGSTLLIP